MDQSQLKNFYNADCMEIMRTMKDKSVEMILTDIPYNLHNTTLYQNLTHYKEDENGHRYKTSRGGRPAQWGNKSVNQLTFNLNEFVNECLRIAKGTIIIFCGQSQLTAIWNLFDNYRDENKGMLRQLIYQKTNPNTLNVDKIYKADIENIVLYKFPKSTFNGKYLSSILTYPIESGATRIHPCEKNHALLKQLIEENTNKGDIVFDPCMGSGSTCLVAYQCGRNTLGCEIDKEIYDKAILRLEDKGNYQFDLLEDFL